MNPGSSRVSKAVGTSGKGPNPDARASCGLRRSGIRWSRCYPRLAKRCVFCLAVKFAADLSGHFFESNESSAGLTRGAHNR